MIHDGSAYADGANFLYSDVTSARNTFENNVMYGAPQTYYEYDKDAYDTKVVDNNEDYYDQ